MQLIGDDIITKDEHGSIISKKMEMTILLNDIEYDKIVNFLSEEFSNTSVNDMHKQELKRDLSTILNRDKYIKIKLHKE